MRRLAIGVVSLLFAAFGTSAPTTSATVTHPATPTTSSAVAPHATAPPGPIVVIFFENRSRDQILGNPCCPYMTAEAKKGRTFTNYYAITHPSLPNYLAVSGGTTCGKVGKDGVIPYCTNTNIWDQMEASGTSRRVYEESMPSRCSLTDTHLYAVRHNPEAIYDDQQGTPACASHDLALPGSFTTLPAFTFVTPNLCNDMHNCSATTGDNWLRTWLPKFLKVPGTRVVVTFDEGSTDNHVAAFEVGAGVPIAVNPHPYNHYSLLAAIEDALGLTRLENAITATPLPI